MDVYKIRERINNIKKMLESALALAKDPRRQESIKASLVLVMKDLKKIDEGTFTEEDLKKYEFSTREDKIEQVEISFDILETIPKISPSPHISDKELVDVNSYMDFFEREYLPLFTTKYLKVIFSYQHKLDYFFSEFRRVQMLFSKYVELIENISRSDSDAYISEMQKLRRKRFRELLFNIDKFFEEIQEFLESILENPTSDGILLEPHFLIEFDSDQNKVINNIEAIDAIKDMYKFVIEFRNYIGVVGV
ncbi:MAG: hypothetical protein N2712_02715 [Brevinematales bacterium]|nr:hypothetical protein [Brevinematales bacterium]